MLTVVNVLRLVGGSRFHKEAGACWTDDSQANERDVVREAVVFYCERTTTKLIGLPER